MKTRVSTGIAAKGVITTEYRRDPIAAKSASENIRTKKFSF
jgi:hypothetical protein